MAGSRTLGVYASSTLSAEEGASVKNIWPAAIALTGALCAPLAHAGFLEDLLARPAIQNLLGRQSDLQVTVRNCTNAAFRQRNLAGCEQAEQAARLAAMPPELRAVMSVPASSASLRELCLIAQSTPQKNTHLCAELFKADAGFKTLAEEAQRASAEAQRAAAAKAGAEDPR